MPHQNQNPWDNKKKSLPPENMLAALIQKIRDFHGEEQRPGSEGPGSGGQEPASGLGKFIFLVMAILVVQALYVSWYTIEPGEKGVVLRFGKHVRTTEPGPHYKIPYVEKLINVDVEGVRTAESGFNGRSSLASISAEPIAILRR